VRATQPVSPPSPFSSRSARPAGSAWATEGVLYVWSLLELSTAVVSERNSGIQRSEAPSSATLASAAGSSGPATAHRRRRSTSAARSSTRRCRRCSPAAAGAGVASIATSWPSVAPAGRTPARPRPVEVSFVRPGQHVGRRVAGRHGRAARLGGDHHGVGEERRALGHRGELRGADPRAAARWVPPTAEAGQVPGGGCAG